MRVRRERERERERELLLGALHYLLATLSYGGGELADYHIYTLEGGHLQLLDLLFHYGLKGQVWGKETGPAEEEGGW